MKESWVSGMTKEQREEFKQLFERSKTVRARLVEILELRRVENRNQQCDMKDFESPNWQYKQAAYLGKEKTLQSIIDLLS